MKTTVRFLPQPKQEPRSDVIQNVANQRPTLLLNYPITVNAQAEHHKLCVTIGISHVSY